MAQRRVTHVLDTHAWVHAVNEDPLPDAVLSALSAPENRFGIAAISLWEVAKLVQLKRLILSVPLAEWYARALHSELTILPLTPAQAAVSTQLKRVHRDPADELIVAAALEHRAILITRDPQIIKWGQVRTLWQKLSGS